MKKNDSSNENEATSSARRTFLKGAAATTVSMVAVGAHQAKGSDTARLWRNPRRLQLGAPSQLDHGVRVTHSVCVGCNARCGNRIVVKDGVVENISGNPFNPYNSHAETIPYETPVAETLGLTSPWRSFQRISWSSTRRMRRP
jgi:tetrathionate reductase subunit A